jgi:glutamate-1-semialdehyde 2,1-aminomutase
MLTGQYVYGDRVRLSKLVERETSIFSKRTSKSKEAFEQSRKVLLGGVPMSWMSKWSGGYPIFFKSARDSKISDLDGNIYVDFCLGDTGAMAGHSPGATVSAVIERVRDKGGITTMLPSLDAVNAASALSARFPLPYWQFTLSATDANRFALRFARQITGRSKVLVFSYCYHGTVDESFIVLDNGVPRSRTGNVGPAVDPTDTTVVVEFNDIEAVRRALSTYEIAAVLTEPALTNIGIVLPVAGFHEELRRLCSETSTLLIIDETHTFSAGYGGATELFGLDPDMITIGKSIGGGVPVGAYGVSDAVAERLLADQEADLVDTGGVGGTLAGNALSVAAVAATLEHVFTKEAFAKMIDLCATFEQGVTDAFFEFGAPFCAVRLGARIEYRFTPSPPLNGGESASYGDDLLDQYFHLYMANRGVLMTPFHNMALMAPTTTLEDVETHTNLFKEAVGELF